MGDPCGSLRRCRLCSQNTGFLFESPDYTTEVPGAGSSRMLKAMNPIFHSRYGVVISCIAMYTHKSKDIAVMHSQVHQSHCSRVCYVVAIANTAVAKSLNSGGKAWHSPQSPVAHGNHGLCSFLLADRLEWAIQISKFPTFSRPSILAFRLILLFLKTYQRWL